MPDETGVEGTGAEREGEADTERERETTELELDGGTELEDSEAALVL